MVTIACQNGMHEDCENRRCECSCHPSPKQVKDAREAAHQAVKAFDLQPSAETATKAIDTLYTYRALLRKQR